MYVTNTFSAAVSARAKVARSTVLQVGIQPSLYNKSVDPSRITLGDQFDPFYGQILDVSPELINFYADRVTMFDIGAGIYGETDFQYCLARCGKSGIWFFGLSHYRIHPVVFVGARLKIL